MKLKLVFIFSLLIIMTTTNTITAQLKFHGVKIKVVDMNEAIDFYVHKLGFQVQSQDEFPDQVILKTNSFPVYLELTKNNSSSVYPKEARTGLVLQTNKLLPKIDELREEGIEFYDSLLTRNGVGISIPFEDPFGNVLHLIEVQIWPVDGFNEPRVYNAGVTIADMDTAIDFYINKLGFLVWSKNYLPDALPLKHEDESFAFMIHYEDGLAPNSIRYSLEAHTLLMFETLDLDIYRKELKSKGVSIIDLKSEEKFALKDTEGNMIEVIKARINLPSRGDE